MSSITVLNNIYVIILNHMTDAVFMKNLLSLRFICFHCKKYLLARFFFLAFFLRSKMRINTWNRSYNTTMPRSTIIL